MAANPLIELRMKNYDMQLNSNGWTDDNKRALLDDERDQNNWLHSDIKSIAMPYVYPTYEKMLSIGGFVEESAR